MNRRSRRRLRPATSAQKSQTGIEQKWWWALASGVILVIIGIIGTYLISAPQEVRGQKAVDEEKESQLAKKPSLLSEVKASWDGGIDGWHWVFHKKVPIDDLRVSNDVAMQNLGGMRVGTHCYIYPQCWAASRDKVTLVGHRRHKVRITGMRARILNIKPRPAGTLATLHPEGGGPVDSIFIDLDSKEKNAVTIDEVGKPTRTDFFSKNTRYAEEGEPLEFEVIAGTQRKLDYEWELEVDVSYNETSETLRIRPSRERPFRTIGWSPDWPYSAHYDFDREIDRYSDKTRSASTSR